MKLTDDIEIYQGDRFDVLNSLSGRKIDLIVTDPPYIVNTTGGGGSVNSKLKLKDSLQDLTTQQDITQGYDIDAMADIIYSLQQGNINAYFWCNKLQIPQYFATYVGRYGCKFEILCWHKHNALPTYSNKYLSDTEYCLYFFKSGRTKPESYVDAQTYWVEAINHADKKKYQHPTIKPLAMIDRIIRNSSKTGDTILDPFMGSGTTGVACSMNDRKFIGIEINNTYFNIAKDRINKCVNDLNNNLFSI